MQLRRFVYHFAAVPKLLSTKSVAAHIMNKDLLEIFEVGMICLFLHVPAKPGFVHKYTPRSPFPELIDMKTSNSLAKEIMKFGKPAVLNSMRHVTFLAAVDGVSGVKVSRVLSMPLKEVSTGNVFGVIHFINKGFNDEPFGEADEFYATVFASQVQTILASVDVYNLAAQKEKLLSALMRAPTELTLAIPKIERYTYM